MDNGGFRRDVEEGTELGLVKNPQTATNTTNGTKSTNISIPKSTVSTSAGPSSSCRPEVCQAARRRYQAPDLSGGPWHRHKTIFLIGTIVLLVIWIIVYAVLSHLNLV